ncbi:pentapeptide repeat-containing protein [Aeoliella sp. ICT_H6.2]|uniref:Pentapeptide repeat-containing protein n=1 Tax=Aeoliella straminimaris TaxID=2954799 RepID=A0A9X2JFE0_9BACT|nr:pentapeptide repeat-containing protein [Aeoliella straminimaris]MCO6043601.1 pentapeptide repeat-containing protein [Aeoliella straminimaris]
MTRLLLWCCATALALQAGWGPTPARADIYQWEYIDPTDPSQGRQQSTTLAPDGAGLVPLPRMIGSSGDLTKAYLSGAQLSGAFFYNTTLVNADFSSSNLRYVRFIGSNLESAHLRSTNLAGAHFSGATLTGTDFTNAEIRNTSFGNTTDGGLSPEQIYSTASYKRGDLTGISLERNDLANWDFADQNLTYANFDLAGLDGADLSGADLRHASFIDSTVDKASFIDADVRGAIFNDAPIHRMPFPYWTHGRITNDQLYSTRSYKDADLEGIILHECDLRDWDFAGQNLTDSGFESAWLNGADFSRANLTNANFSYASLATADFSDAVIAGLSFAHTDLTATQLYSTASYKVGDLAGINFTSGNLRNLDLADQQLAYANLGSSSLQGANLSGADLTGAVLKGAYLQDTNVAAAKVRGASFASTTTRGFTSERLYSTESYQTGDLVEMDLSYNDLTNWDFAGKDLTGASFQGATLTGVNFAGAEVRKANFHKTSTSGAGISVTQLYSTASYQSGDLTGIDLRENDLAGCDFRGINLTDANLTGATLTGIDFTDAIVSGTTHGGGNNAISAAQLYSTASYKTGDLSGVRFTNSDLGGWNLEGQNLRQSSIVGADLAEANMTKVNLHEAFFMFGSLAGADFTGANITNARFQEIDYVGADFSGADIRGTRFFHTRDSIFTPSQLYSTLSYEISDLSGIQLASPIPGNWDLSGIKLVGCEFGALTMVGADLRGANLASTWFSTDWLPSGRLIGTNLSGADTRGGALDTSDIIKHNFIYPDGHIEGLHIEASETMRLWDFDPELIPRYKSEPIGDIPIVVTQAMSIHTDGTLRIVFEDDQWGSTVHYESAIPVELAGTLELLFDGHVAPRRLIGTTFQLFNWTGVDPHGEFATIVADPRATWDTSALYTTGEVTLVSAVPEPAGVFLAWVAIGLAAWVVQARQVGVRKTPLNSGSDLI